MSGVYELSTDGESRLIHPAGSPDAEAFQRRYGDPEHPVDLEPISSGADTERRWSYTVFEVPPADETEPTVPEAPDAPDDTPAEPEDDTVPETEPEAEPPAGTET